MSTIVVCKLFKLARIDGNYTKDLKQLVRPRAVITREFMEETNDNYVNGGMLYELDQEATDFYYMESKEANEKRIALAEIKEVKATEVLSNALSTVIEGKNRKSKKNEAAN